MISKGLLKVALPPFCVANDQNISQMRQGDAPYGDVA
jgi:hypothetical protein